MLSPLFIMGIITSCSQMEIAFGKKEARKFTTDLWKELFSYSKSAAKYK